jgi:hypothetical protein
MKLKVLKKIVIMQKITEAAKNPEIINQRASVTTS